MREREREIQAPILVIYILRWSTSHSLILSMFYLILISRKKFNCFFLFIYLSIFLTIYLYLHLSLYLYLSFYLSYHILYLYFYLSYLYLYLYFYLSITFFDSLHFTLSIILIFLVVLAARIKSKLSFTSSSGSRSQRINLQK